MTLLLIVLIVLTAIAADSPSFSCLFTFILTVYSVYLWPCASTVGLASVSTTAGSILASATTSVIYVGTHAKFNTSTALYAIVAYWTGREYGETIAGIIGLVLTAAVAYTIKTISTSITDPDLEIRAPMRRGKDRITPQRQNHFDRENQKLRRLKGLSLYVLVLFTACSSFFCAYKVTLSLSGLTRPVAPFIELCSSASNETTSFSCTFTDTIAPLANALHFLNAPVEWEEVADAKSQIFRILLGASNSARALALLVAFSIVIPAGFSKSIPKSAKGIAICTILLVIFTSIVAPRQEAATLGTYTVSTVLSASASFAYFSAGHIGTSLLMPPRTKYDVVAFAAALPPTIIAITIAYVQQGSVHLFAVLCASAACAEIAALFLRSVKDAKDARAVAA